MNWVAHVLLSEPHIHFQLGNLIADFTKGKMWPSIHPLTVAGLSMHRKIDAYTDSHRIVRRSQRRLRDKGLLRAVAIDLSYDHMLIKHWADYEQGLTARAFIDDFYRRAEQVLGQYPADIQHFVSQVIAADTLGRYADVSGIQRGMRKIDQRLSTRVLSRECASNYYEDVLREYTRIECDFLEFFPELQQYVSQQMLNCLSQTTFNRWRHELRNTVNEI
jgi:acyl carrier protein phosphodiesterase